MNFETFRDTFIESGYATSADIAQIGGTFSKNNLTRWCQDGLLIKLRNGYYTFPELTLTDEFLFYAANKMYGESVISTYSALVHHGFLPPQLNTQISSVCRLKTCEFRNPIGRFTFQHLKDELFFGYEPHEIEQFTFYMSTPEKALLDLFYLFPSYFSTEKGIRHFALEEQALYRELNTQKLYEYLENFENKALEYRISLFLHVYGI